MKNAIRRFNFCYRFMGMPFGVSLKAAIFGKDVFKFGG